MEFMMEPTPDGTWELRIDGNVAIEVVAYGLGAACVSVTVYAPDAVFCGAWSTKTNEFVRV